MKIRSFLSCNDFAEMIKMINKGEKPPGVLNLPDLRVHVISCKDCRLKVNSTGQAILKGQEKK